MQLTIPAEGWPALVEGLCLWFRHADPAALGRFRGDGAKLVTYLADCHDLTEAEAAEQLEIYLAAHHFTLPGARAA